MGRARRARKIAATAAYGGGIGAAGIGLLTLAGYGVLKAEVLLARRIVGQPFEGAPDDDALYGAGLGQPVELVVLGDSSAAPMPAALLSPSTTSSTGSPRPAPYRASASG